MYIQLIEYGVLNYPEGMENCRMYRIEYGGHAQDCLVEGTIWLPRHVDPEEFEGWIMGKFKEDEDADSIGSDA